MKGTGCFFSQCTQTKLKHQSYQAMAKTSLQLAVQFLFHTYLRTKKKLRYGSSLYQVI